MLYVIESSRKIHLSNYQRSAQLDVIFFDTELVIWNSYE